MKKIIYVDYAVANSFNDRIEINKDLLKYPKLYNKILRHEQSHTNKIFSFTDLLIDFHNDIPSFQLLKFMVSRPKTWLQFFPIIKTKKGIFIDANLLLIYLTAIFVFCVIVFFK